jgi:hypothetical protein
MFHGCLPYVELTAESQFKLNSPSNCARLNLRIVLAILMTLYCFATMCMERRRNSCGDGLHNSDITVLEYRLRITGLLQFVTGGSYGWERHI